MPRSPFMPRLLGPDPSLIRFGPVGRPDITPGLRCDAHASPRVWRRRAAAFLSWWVGLVEDPTIREVGWRSCWNGAPRNPQLQKDDASPRVGCTGAHTRARVDDAAMRKHDDVAATRFIVTG